MFRKLLLSQLFVFFFLSSFAQEKRCTSTITLQVFDQQTRLPLPNALLMLDGKKSATMLAVEGRASFTNLCKGSHSISIKYLGYEEEIINVQLEKDEQSVNVFLLPISKSIATVNITTERTNLQTTMGKMEIKGADLERTRGLSLADALKVIPGVTTLQTGPTISKPIIQGMHSSRILIINNGIRQEGQQWGSEHAPEIDAFIANKLTVIKGAGSIRYGSDAIGGVILVEPNPLPDSGTIGGEINLVGISNGRQGVASGTVEGNIEKLSLQYRLQGTLKRAGNIRSPDYYLSNTGFSERNYSWALGYQGRNFRTEVFYSFFRTDIGVFRAAHIGNLSDLEVAFNSDTPLISAGFSYDIDRPKQEVLHELVKSKTDWYLHERGKLQIVLARQYNLRNEYDKDLPLNDSLAALDLPELHYEITSYNADLSYQYSWTGNMTSAIGVTGVFQKNTFEGRQFIPNFINDNYAAYSINQLHYGKWMFDLGVRYDQEFLKIYRRNSSGQIESPERNFRNLNFNTGFEYEWNKFFDLHLNLGTAFRAPGVNELYADGLHHGEGKYIYSDDQLNPEYAKAVIAGVDFRFGKKYYGHVDAYYKQLDGYIYLEPVFPPTLSIRGAFPSFKYKQVDAYFTGVDAWFHAEFTSKIYSTHKGNIVRAYNTTSNLFLPYIPSDRFENTIGYRIPKVGYFENTEFEFSVLNVLKQTRLEPNSDYKDSPPAYMLINVNASSRLEMGTEHLEIGFSINNLLNTRYREYMNSFRYFTDEPGISFVTRIKYHF